MSESDDSSQVERWIAGALKNAIDAHGPITKERVGSAAKRVRRQLEAAGDARVSDERVTRALVKGMAKYTDSADQLTPLLLGALADDGLEVVEAAARPVTGGQPRPLQPHHPGSKARRKGGFG